MQPFIEYLNQQRRTNKLVVILPTKFPISNYNGNVTDQELAFKQYLTTHHLSGGIKNHYGIIITVQVPNHIQQAIIDACDVSDQSYLPYEHKYKLTCLICGSSCFISTAMLAAGFEFHIYWLLATLLLISNIPCLITCKHYYRMTTDINAHNHKLINKLTKFYEPVLTLANTKIPTINRRPIQHTNTVTHTNTKKANVPSDNVTYSDDTPQNTYLITMINDHIYSADDNSANNDNTWGDWSSSDWGDNSGWGDGGNDW